MNIYPLKTNTFEMEVIENELRPFLNNPNFVFKSCQKNWIVVLEKVYGRTKTNEERDVFDPNCAKYRGSRFKVVAIINKFDPTIKRESVESSQCSSVIYKVGEIVEPDEFDLESTKVCAKGIHYFLTPEPAYYYELDTIQNGILKQWHDNGQIWIMINYKNGELDGEYISWYENGQVEIRCHYKNGERNGEFTSYYENGKLNEKCYFENGEIDGEYQNFYENGQQEEQYHYKNGERDGDYISWYNNGQLEIRCHYKNGIKDGEYQKRYTNGRLQIRCHYKNGERDGEYKSWYKNGKRDEECYFKNGERDGKYQNWDKNGQLFEYYYFKELE